MTQMSPFRTQLENAVNARHSRMNPFTEKWVERRPDADPARRMGVPALPVRVAVSALVRHGVRGLPRRRRPRLPAREHHRGGGGNQARRPPHPLCRGLRGDAGADVETTRQLPTTRGLTAWCFEMSHKPFHIAAAGLLVGLESQVPGHLQAQPSPAQDALRLHRPRGRVLRHPHRGRRGPRRARLPDRRAPLHDPGAAGGGGRRRAPGHRDAVAVHDGPPPRLCPEGGHVSVAETAR